MIETWLINLLGMQFQIEDRLLLSKLANHQQIPSPFRRRAKIYPGKLPHDFFASSKLLPYEERQSRAANRKEVQTQANTRKYSDRGDVENQFVHQVLTARKPQKKPDSMQLILGIIQSTREIRKTIRKNSLELRRQNNSCHTGRTLKVELPPLYLRKGVTTNF